MKNNKKKILLLIIPIILVVLILLGSSYAYFIASDEGEKQSFTTGNLVVDYEKKTSVISIDNMYPMTDVQGLETTPHEFKVTNNGNIKAKYQVRLELDKNLKNSVPLEYIKISYSKNNGSYTTPVLLSSLSSNLVFIKDQVIDIKTSEEDCDTYKIKMWLDISAPNDVMKKEFKARIVVDSIQYLADNSYSVDTIPVIYLNKNTDGNIDIRLKKGETYTELGVEKVLDDKDTISNNITPVYEYYNEEEHELEIVSSINTNQVGLYYATYQVEDSNHNIGKAVRVINVIDNTPPRIEFKTGIESTLEIEENDNYIEDIANTITVDNNNQVVVIGEVKTDIPGKDYIIRYIVIDSNNNINSKTRTITVKEKPTAPVITGGTGDNWVSEAQTILVAQEGTAYSGVDYYEYYTTQDETDIPDLETERTGVLEKDNTDLLIEEDGETYIYYRTVSGLGSKSVWSSPQVVKLRTKLVDKIFSYYPIETITSLPDSSLQTTSEVKGENGLYVSTATNSGNPTYYFRGQVENNYVDFAEFTWRIVRINEDGTIRLIMQDAINEGQQYVFNANSNVTSGNFSDMYYSNGTTSGTVKYELNAWYNSHIANNQDYLDNIVLGKYCQQAKAKYNSDGTSDDSTTKYYSVYTPNFKCSSSKNLSLSVGLITYDEVRFAGAFIKIANNYYLLNSNLTRWWTMSAAGVNSENNPRVWAISYTGNISGANYYKNKSSIRPVINLKADTLITGIGTSTNKYIVR